MGNIRCSGYTFRPFIARDRTRSHAQGEIQVLFPCPMYSRTIIQDMCVYPLEIQRAAVSSLCNVNAPFCHTTVGLAEDLDRTNEGSELMYCCLLYIALPSVFIRLWSSQRKYFCILWKYNGRYSKCSKMLVSL